MDKIPLLKNPEYINYTNEDVLFRFSNMYNMENEEIEDLFLETKKFLALSSSVPGLYVNNDILIIDEMWHNFILFTTVYESFCKKFFNRFIHHIPASKKERESISKLRKENPEKVNKQFLEDEEHMLNVVYDYLGEDTVVKWFQYYPEKYTKEYIKSIMR